MEGEDLMGHLLRNRIIFVGGRINDEVSSCALLACKRYIVCNGTSREYMRGGCADSDQSGCEHAGDGNLGRDSRHKAVYQLPRCVCVRDIFLGSMYHVCALFKPMLLLQAGRRTP